MHDKRNHATHQDGLDGAIQGLHSQWSLLDAVLQNILAEKDTHTHTQQYMPIVTIWLWGAANGWMDGWMDRWLGEYCFKDVKGYLSPNNDENEGVDTPTYVSTTCVSTTTTYVCGRTHNACTKLSPLLSNRRRLCYIKPGVTRGCQQQMYTCVRTYMYQLSVLVAYAYIFACIFACVA